MSESRRPRCTACAAAAGLLLAAAIASGCGASAPAAGVSGAQSTTTAQSTLPLVRTSEQPPAKDPPATGSAAAAPKKASSHHPIAPAHPVPAAFRPAPGAPSDEEVQKELAQMAAVQRQEHEQALSAAAADLAGLLPWSMEPKSGTQVSVASVFTDYGLGLACGGLLGRHQLGVAHKTAPCGTLITFTYAGRSITVPVIDRGPYIAGREWDLTGATAEALGFPGLGPIQWSVAS